MACDVVTKNGILFTYMMSASSVTFPCLSIISVGSSCSVAITHVVFFHVVLPCGDSMFTPKMSLACRMLALVSRQFGIMLYSVYFG